MSVMIWMWWCRRETLLAEHNFYVAEGTKRLTNQFSDEQTLWEEAKIFAQEWREQREQNFDPDRDDEGCIYEDSMDIQVSLFTSLIELGNSTQLALISGMFHKWDISLRAWLTSGDCFEIFQFNKSEIWKLNFNQIFELFKPVQSFNDVHKIHESLNKYRLVVNVYKHGKGQSLNDLKKYHPQFFKKVNLPPINSNISSEESNFVSKIENCGYTDLCIKTEHIDELSNAIQDFWKSVPEYIEKNDFEQFPKWFNKLT